MKSKLILLTLICLGTLCSAQNRIDKQGRRQGPWIKTDKNGSKIFEGTFQDGKETGVFNYYYADGTLRIRNTYTEPGRYCSHEAYDEKGHLLARGFYNQKNRDSIWHFYNEEGRLVKTASYKMGIKQGVHVIFTSTGDTAEVTHYVDNHREGRWWKRIGEKGWITCNYSKGLTQGRLVEYNEQGQLAREGNYRDGAKDGRNRFYENGECVIEETWNMGMLSSRKILLHTPAATWYHIDEIAYVQPRGNKGCTLTLKNGEKRQSSEMLETVSERMGWEQFLLVDKKNRIYAHRSCILGLTQDSEGRTLLELDPKPAFTIFPDEDCVKMVEALQRGEGVDEE